LVNFFLAEERFLLDGDAFGRMAWVIDVAAAVFEIFEVFNQHRPD